MKKILIICALTALTVTAVRAQLIWFDGQSPVTYQVVGRVDPVVKVALQMFSDDMEQVTGQKPVAAKQAVIKIMQGKGQDDGFSLSVSPDGRQILVEGHNGRGTAYGLLELSRLAGVSPWVWWGDVVPERKARLTLPADFRMQHTPSVQYRGIFINDEDWSLREWSSKTFEPLGIKNSIGPRTYKELFKLLLRLRANTIWPAMHEGGPGFFTVAGNKQMADSCGILIGTSHCEPLLRNNVAEWDKQVRGDYNYITNRQQVQQYWTERLKQVRGSEELFTIGMRGIHDGSMEGVKTPEEKLNGLQQVIDDQRELIRKYYSKNVEQVPQVFIPYKEVLEIMESGLRVPDDVMLMWCDDNYGYMTRLSDAEQQRRSGGGGVYYHLSYWGRPHDHLWLTTMQPGLVYWEMKTAYDHNARRLWIVNVHDPKVAAYDLSLFLDMAWDIDGVNPSTLSQHLQQWLAQQFGPQVAAGIAPAMQEYYRLNAIRRPEFMGWTQVELDKKKFPGGKSVPTTTQFTLSEACQRIADFGRVEATVEAYARMVPERLQDAYFAAVLYPVHAAAAMTRKMLSDPVESRRAYEEIQRLTERYNQLGGGKWQYLMSAAPRALPVFGEVRTQLAADTLGGCCVVARNACSYTSASENCQPVQMLGHSMQAVALPKGGELFYEFNTCHDGEATLYTAMIPTQPNDKGDLRYSVQVDDQSPVVISLKEKYRSEGWKQNVLRGQALKQTPVKLAKGHHTLRVRALDDHIVFDQWMLDFAKNRPFYVIPVQK
ncbi:MAG: glycosyl hydrolase 115 family protein [Prevotella sp.]|nr:glycosyl hydrolase 115 family protein [Prevotella sp.]